MSPPRTPLLRPDRYFGERTASPGRGIAVIALLVIGWVVLVYGLGGVFAANIDGTVEVSNPAYPGDAFCDGDGPGDTTPSGCDEPATVERNIDQLIWEAIGSVAGQLAVGFLIVWLVLAGLLHGGSALADGEGGFGRSLAVTAWGMVPALFGVVVAIVALALTFDPVTVSSGDSPEVLRQQVMAQFGVLRLVGGLSSVVTMAWGATVWRFRLLHQRDISGTAATAVAGTVAGLLLLFGAA
jgi:hypothetical protein